MNEWTPFDPSPPVLKNFVQQGLPWQLEPHRCKTLPHNIQLHSTSLARGSEWVWGTFHPSQVPLALDLFSGATGLEQRQSSYSQVINAIIVWILILQAKPPAQGGLGFLESFPTEGLLELKHYWMERLRAEAMCGVQTENSIFVSYLEKTNHPLLSRKSPPCWWNGWWP